VVAPARTAGGTRRYRAADLERLRLVKAAVDAGARIGEVAKLELAELRERAGPLPPAPAGALEEILAAVERLDASEARRLLALQFSTLGPAPFVRELATPLLREIGERWTRNELGIAAEHLASAVIRSQLGAALQPSAASLRGPRIVFATLEGERHEIGLQMAAVVALGAGANPLYLGLGLPTRDCVDAVLRGGASALAISVVSVPRSEAQRATAALREALPPEVRIWIGGHGAPGLSLPEGVQCLTDLDRLEQEVALLALERRRP
jgi:methanogenic corrinoid protein MtbC1